MVSATGPLARVGRVVVLLTQPILKGSRGAPELSSRQVGVLAAPSKASPSISQWALSNHSTCEPQFPYLSGWHPSLPFLLTSVR